MVLALDELWNAPPGTPQDRRVGKMQTAPGQYLDLIAEAELVVPIPAYARDDHLAVKVPPCKKLLYALSLLITALCLPKKYCGPHACISSHHSPNPGVRQVECRDNSCDWTNWNIPHNGLF